jgi:hypothetical protein
MEQLVVYATIAHALKGTKGRTQSPWSHPKDYIHVKKRMRHRKSSAVLLHA